MAGSTNGSYAEKDKQSAEALASTLSESETDKISEELQQVSMVDENLAGVLINAGFTEIGQLAQTTTEKLLEIDGLDEEKAEKLKEEVKQITKEREDDEDPNENESSDGDDELAQWLTGDSDKDLGGLLTDEIEEAKEKGTKSKGKKGKRQVSQDDEQDYGDLKAWLSGEKDSFSGWLGEESFEEEREFLEEEIAEKEEKIEETKTELEEKMDEAQNLKKEFEKRLEEIETGDFDAESIVEENAELREKVDHLSSQVGELREERESILDEMEEIKQGSVAMLKYLKAQKMKNPTGGGSGGATLQEGQVAVANEELESLREKNQKLESKIDAMKSSGDYQDIEDDEILSELKEKEKLLESKEEEIQQKNERIQDLRDDLSFKEDELKDFKEKMQYKEDELNDREEDLRHREEVMKKERQELAALREEFGNTTEKEKMRRLEDLQKEIDSKEREMKAKEKYIEQKERELRAREEDMIDEELEERQEEILQEIEQEKAKTGTGRLDDLLLGGIPLGSNVSIYGPPHVGKKIMINSFMAEGIEKGIPALWVITDQTIDKIREEMKFVLPTYEEYELRGLVYYVDAYSMSMGEMNEDMKEKEHVKYIENQSDVQAINDAVEEFIVEINKKHRYYRMAFESVSTIIAYLNTETTFRSLQPFAGRRKRDNAVALYTLEKGMHSEQDISMLGHMMDGEIEFKSDQLKTYLRVSGLGDVQTRDWIQYTSSKSGISMGSFSLDTIR